MELQRAVSVVADNIDVAVGDQLQIADPTRLRNPLNTPMWVDSIVIAPNYNSNVPNDVQTPASYLGNLMCRIRLGREPLTDGFVPVITLDRIPNTSRFALSGGVYTIGQIGGFSYMWRFKKPLFVPAGGFIVTELWNTGATAAVNYTDLAVTYRGRSLPTGFVPDEVHIPWCASFEGPALSLNPIPADQTLQTKKLDLSNPFAVPLKINRMTGTININDAPSSLNTNSLLLLDQQYALIRVTDSAGGIIVRDPTPFGHLFQILDNAWQMNAVIPPQQFWIAMIQLLYSNFGNQTSTIAQPYVAISGYRSLPYSRVSLA